MSRKGKYSQTILRTVRCEGCGALCANHYTLHEHKKTCEQAKERAEFFPVPAYQIPSAMEYLAQSENL